MFVDPLSKWVSYGMGADIFDIPIPDITDVAADTAKAIATNPFKDPKLPPYHWYDPMLYWLNHNEGVVWAGAIAAVGLLFISRKR